MTTKTGFKFGDPGIDIGSVAVSWDHLRNNYSNLPATSRFGGLYTKGSGTLLSGQSTSETNWSQYNSMRFKKISGFNDGGSSYHYLVGLRDDGTLWAVGYNQQGQLGLGDTTTRTSWTQIGSDNTWTDVECTAYTVHALKSNNTLWSWGNNNGSGRYTSNQVNNYTTTPTQHSGTWKYINTSTRNGKRYIIDTNGVAYGWGTAFDYTLYVTANTGGSTTVYAPSPVKGSYNTNIKQIANGGAFAMIDENGNAYYAQYENFTSISVPTPIPLPNDTGNWDQIEVIGFRNSATYLGVKRDGTLWYYRLIGGSDQWIYTGVSNVRRVLVSNGFYNQFHILTRSGRLLLWYYSDYYNLYEAAKHNNSDYTIIDQYFLPQFELKTQETAYYGGQYSAYSKDLADIPAGRILDANFINYTYYLSIDTGDF